MSSLHAVNLSQYMYMYMYSMYVVDADEQNTPQDAAATTGPTSELHMGAAL